MRCVVFFGLLIIGAAAASAQDGSSTSATPEAIDMSVFLGDPDLPPQPEARFQDGRYKPDLPPVNVNQGHPIHDYGHFRLNARVYNRTDANKPGLVIASDRASTPEDHRHFENHAWGDGSLLRYSIAMPAKQHARPDAGWPLVIICPGSGAVGQQKVGWRKNRPDHPGLWVTPTYRQQYPAVILAMHPQARTHEYDSAPDRPTRVQTTPVFDAYLEVIDHVAATRRIDPDRLYLTGFSMGGATVWQLLRARPDFFAAAVPCAGQPLFEPEDVERIKHVPIWMIMAQDDTWNGSRYYILSYDRLRQAGAEHVRFWEVQGVGHSGRCLELTPLAPWLLAQRRGRPPQP